MPGKVVQACNSSTVETEAEESQVQSQTEVFSELEVSLNYTLRSCSKNIKANKQTKYIKTIPAGVGGLAQ